MTVRRWTLRRSASYAGQAGGEGFWERGRAFDARVILCTSSSAHLTHPFASSCGLVAAQGTSLSRLELIAIVREFKLTEPGFLLLGSEPCFQFPALFSASVQMFQPRRGV